MKCPQTLCQCLQISRVHRSGNPGGGKTVLYTFSNGNSEHFTKIPVRLKGANAFIRWRQCLVCKHQFWTIELTEADYLKLLRGIPIVRETTPTPPKVR